MITLRHEEPIPHKKKNNASFLVLDKPPGPSSHETTAWVKKMLGASKAGHSGTLDPKVTGVLVIALNKATKLLRAFEKTDKEYVCIARFKKMPSKQELEKTLKKFRGYITQIPPKESAVARKKRKRIIYELEILEIKDKLLLFKTKCQHGTYIRVLVKDIAKALKTEGEMLELRRTKAGALTEEESVTLQELSDACRAKKPEKILLTPLQALNLKQMIIGNNAVSALCHGANLAAPGVVALDETIKKGELIALITASKELIGLGIALKNSDEIAEGVKGFVVDTKTIIMDKNTYPKHWK